MSQNFKCIKDVYIDGDIEQHAFIEGKVYEFFSLKEGFSKWDYEANDEQGEHHVMSKDWIAEYFVLV